MASALRPNASPHPHLPRVSRPKTSRRRAQLASEDEAGVIRRLPPRMPEEGVQGKLADNASPKSPSKPPALVHRMIAVQPGEEKKREPSSAAPKRPTPSIS